MLRGRASSLRVRLVVGVLLVTAVGLAVADVVGVQVLRRVQVRRIDTELRALDGPRVLRTANGSTELYAECEAARPPEQAGRRGPNTFFQTCLSADGTVVGPVTTQSTLPEPRVPVLAVGAARARSGKPFTVDAVSGGGQWRLVVTPFSDGSGSLVVGQSLRELSSTTDQLVLIDLAVAGAVLVALTGLGYFTVRLGLRPLREVTETADVIAGGDLGRRAPVANPHSEVGRLGTAFNSMLEQIQGALRDRERSNQRLRTFAADASHELRTPLTSIRGYAELYRAGAVTAGPDLDRVMGRIEDEAKRMGALVEDLLALARLDQGPSPDLVDVDLAQVADDVVHDARAIEPTRPISVETAGPVVVLGDDGQLRQVATNLLANARAHTPPGTPVVVRAYARGGDAVLEVSDRGPGLDSATASRVFDRFWRADKARSRANGGAGLGLAIVAAIAAVHGGEASVESVPGQGATFRVVLPAEQPG